jgi:hypothetical protein
VTSNCRRDSNEHDSLLPTQAFHLGKSDIVPLRLRGKYLIVGRMRYILFEKSEPCHVFISVLRVDTAFVIVRWSSRYRAINVLAGVNNASIFDSGFRWRSSPPRIRLWRTGFGCNFHRGSSPMMILLWLMGFGICFSRRSSPIMIWLWLPCFRSVFR